MCSRCLRLSLYGRLRVAGFVVEGGGKGDDLEIVVLYATFGGLFFNTIYYERIPF